MKAKSRYCFFSFLLIFISNGFGQIPVISWTVTPNDTVCDGTTVHVIEMASNGPFTSSFFTVGNPPGTGYGMTGTVSGGSTNIYVTFYGSGVYNMCVSATNGSGTGSGCYPIVVLPSTASVSISASPTNPICLGQTMSFTATPTNGGSSPSYQWQVNGVNIGTNSPYFSSATLTNNSIVTVYLISDAPCLSEFPEPATYTVQVVNPQTPGVSINPDPVSICSGGFITFTATPSSGGNNPVYQWNLNGISVGSSGSTYTLNNATAGDQVSVILTSNETCVTGNTASSNTVAVSIAPLPSLTVTAMNNTVCPNQPDTLIVLGTPGTTYTWTPPTGLNTSNNDTVIATNFVNGNYTYYVFGMLNGCSNADTIQISITNTLTIFGGQSQTICSGQSAALSVLGGTFWSWMPNVDLSCANCPNPITTPSVSTIYTVTANTWGCTATMEDTINVIPRATANFSYSVIIPGIPQTVSFVNNSSDALGYYWNFGDADTSGLTNPSHLYLSDGVYPVILIAYGSNGCHDTLQLNLKVNDTIGIIIPNIFTPNNDEINDVFSIKLSGYETTDLRIYDRWGLEIFVSETKSNWDGRTTAGVPCTEGTYYYIFSGRSINSKIHEYKGYIMLVR